MVCAPRLSVYLVKKCSKTQKIRSKSMKRRGRSSYPDVYQYNEIIVPPKKLEKLQQTHVQYPTVPSDLSLGPNPSDDGSDGQLL